MNEVRINKAENGFIVQVIDEHGSKAYVAKGEKELIELIGDFYQVKKPN